MLLLPSMSIPFINVWLFNSHFLSERCYVFTTTNSDNIKTFGVCKRIYPEQYSDRNGNSKSVLPACLCLLSAM